MEKEINQSNKVRIFFRDMAQDGKVKLFPKEDVQAELNKINQQYTLKSNDEDIIALAKISRAKLLCSSDHDLHEDFKKIVKGRIYQTKDHSHLLKKDICP